MFDAAGHEASREGGLVRRDRVFPRVALTGDRHQLCRRHERGDRLHRADDRFPLGLVVAGLVDHRPPVGQVVFEAGGHRVLVGVVVVEGRAAVVVALIHRAPRQFGGRRQLPFLPGGAGNAVVGKIALTQDLRRCEDAGGGAEAQTNRRRERLGPVLHLVPAGDAAVLPQRVQSNRRLADPAVGPAGGEWLVDVERGATLVGGPDRDRGRAGARQMRCLRLHVHVAGGRAAADVGTGRTHEHLHLFQVEDIPGDQPVVADVVDEQAVRRVEPAHVEHVAGGARGAATFAGLQRDARNIAQRFAERGDALRLHRRARDDFNRLRDVTERRRILR